MTSQEIIDFPEENQLRKDITIINEAGATKNDTNASGSQMGSTRDESQDPLLGEQMIMPQTPIELETNVDMIDQEQVPVEETKITITAIIKEINRSRSSNLVARLLFL